MMLSINLDFRFWLMDCQNINEAAKMATELYRETISVPFMAKFVVFSKRHDAYEARLRVFCMTDDKMEKTLETQENFSEIARSRDVEVSRYCLVGNTSHSYGQRKNKCEIVNIDMNTIII